MTSSGARGELDQWCLPRQGRGGRYFKALASKSFRIEPQHFIAEGDHVVVLARITADGQSADQVDVLTFGSDGKLTKFQIAGDTALTERIWGKK